MGDSKSGLRWSDVEVEERNEVELEIDFVMEGKGRGRKTMEKWVWGQEGWM